MTETHVQILNEESSWLTEIIRDRLLKLRGVSGPRIAPAEPEHEGFDSLSDYPPPLLAEESDSPYARFVRKHNLKPEERLLLILSLVNHFKPQLLANEFGSTQQSVVIKSRIGGINGRIFSGFIPTGLTYVMLAGGEDLGNNLRAQELLNADNVFSQNGILFLEPHFKGEPTLSGRLVMSETWVEKLLYTAAVSPRSVKHQNAVPPGS